MKCGLMISMLLLLLLTSAAHGAELRLRCMPKPVDRTAWWTYRIIDGKQCWYKGKHSIAKSLLYWERPLALAPDVGQPGDNGVTPTVSVAVPTFAQRWNDVMNDVAATLWASPIPATQWKIGERQ